MTPARPSQPLDPESGYAPTVIPSKYKFCGRCRGMLYCFGHFRRRLVVAKRYKVTYGSYDYPGHNQHGGMRMDRITEYLSAYAESLEFAISLKMS